jgi:hypothetical protein
MDEQQAKAELNHLFHALIALHKELTDAQFAAYEKDRGAVPGANARFKLLLEDPAFQWLRPLSSVITKIDEATTRRTRTDASHVQDLHREVVDLFAPRDDNELRKQLDLLRAGPGLVDATFAKVETLLDPYRRG